MDTRQKRRRLALEQACAGLGIRATADRGMPRVRHWTLAELRFAKAIINRARAAQDAAEAAVAWAEPNGFVDEVESNIGPFPPRPHPTFGREPGLSSF
jgi:hypothetical protein